MLKMQDRHGAEMLFGPTNEELITNLAKGCIKSYKELPKNIYHIQWKFRDEIRPRFGLMRGREFLMKDAYSFAETEEGAIQQYDDMFATYLRIFKRLGLDVIVSKADTGPIGGDLSHEFHLITKSGAENTIYYNPELISLINKFYNSSKADCRSVIIQMKNTYSVVEELHNAKNSDNLCVTKGIEVGHIFYFGNKYSKAMNATFSLKDGKEEFFYMGSYGIGISRLVAAIIEYSHDEKGIIWPKEVSPFKFGLINLSKGALAIAENIFENIRNVLYDDTEDNAGIKFSKMDLMGFPYQIIVGNNSLSHNTVEIKERKTGIVKIIPLEALNHDWDFGHCE
jgi:prolyl-tRNA synthetase